MFVRNSKRTWCLHPACVRAVGDYGMHFMRYVVVKERLTLSIHCGEGPCFLPVPPCNIDFGGCRYFLTAISKGKQRRIVKVAVDDARALLVDPIGPG